MQRSTAAALAAYAPPRRLPHTTTARLELVRATISAPLHPRWARGVKRGLDILGSAILLVALAPILLLIAIGVRATSAGPAIFAHTRCGAGGQPFRFYKFRSMVCDAEARQRDLLHLNEIEGAAFKIARDPRITRFGRFLRKYSLDELPQLWNVLIGDMSLVGPRPPTPGEAQTYTQRQARRLAVTPGLTGLWQVSGRSKITSFDQWVELDLQYIDRWSLWLDVQILMRTLPVVLRAEGAC
ncbi:MAG TPA: exopolysaccharide biosynthesis polyprenyl glycosylphosphotransferase [Kofleriaceae bacterium]|nr:exopolysaccharide biosynthesis polyprenyl glycosylphosphotransferase [Kofleriaceae bacterium]